MTDFKIQILRDFMPPEQNLYKRDSYKAYKWTSFYMAGTYTVS